MKLTKIKILLAAACVFFLSFLLYFYWGAGSVDSSEDSREFRLEVPSGSGVSSVAKKLKAQGGIRSSFVFYVLARTSVFGSIDGQFMLKSGVYTLNTSMTASDIISVLNSGKQEYIKTVIQEGLTKSQIALILEQEKVCSAEDFLACVCDRTLLDERSIPETVTDFEGFLFPDTYFFSPGMSGKEVLDIMVDNFYSHMENVPGSDKLEFDEFYKKLILASIVEKEFLLNREAPLVASVFANRVKINMGLESCATVNYILEEIEGHEHKSVLSAEDTAIDNPYNTYKWAGLSMIPGPISNPGDVALQAAFNPPRTGYLFFVSKEDGSGEHVFSKTLEEHNLAKYNMKKTRARMSSK